MAHLTSWYWHTLIEKYIYAYPPSLIPPPRSRPSYPSPQDPDGSKQMQVLCVGLPRTGTESLQSALLTLGYDHTYHGWDIIYESPNYCPQWCALVRKKWFPPLPKNGRGGRGGRGEEEEGRESITEDGSTSRITKKDFDEILGHCTAVTDAAGSVFAAELIREYPEAKVVLNYRGDEEGWLRSMDKSVVDVNRSWVFWLLSWCGRECFWVWNVYERYLWPLLFRSPDGSLVTGVMGMGRWVGREHANMIRGLVPKERLLEWQVKDGWEPLCEFLGKEVPNEPFPHANKNFNYKEKEAQLVKRYLRTAVVNVGLTISGLGLTGYFAYSRLVRS